MAGDLLTPEYSLEQIIQQLPEVHRARIDFRRLQETYLESDLSERLRRAPGACRLPGTRRVDEAFEALAGLHGGCDEITATCRGAINKALKDIRQVCPHVTEEEIKRRIFHHRKKWPSIDCTATSLAKHWAILADKPTHDHRSNRGFHPSTGAAKATSDNGIFADA